MKQHRARRGNGKAPPRWKERAMERRDLRRQRSDAPQLVVVAQTEAPAALTWPPENIRATLQACADAGMSFWQVAQRYNVTRSAVAGQARRHGVRFPVTPEKIEKFREVGRRQKGVKRAPKAADWKGYRPRAMGGHAYTETERVQAVAMWLAGVSARSAAGSVGAAPQTLKRLWVVDPAIYDKATQVVTRARADAAEALAARLAERDRVAAEAAAENAKILRRLNNRDREIVSRRLAGECGEAVGRDFAITRERVRQIVMRAISLGLREPPGVALLRTRAA